MIPGKRETLRVSGTAQIVRDRELLQSKTANAKVPALAIAVQAEEAFFHCSRYMIRSHLWQPEHRPSLDGLPTLAETMKDGAAFPEPVAFLQERIESDKEQRPY